MDLAGTIAAATFTFHQSLAMITRVPLFAIEEGEAKEMGRVTANLMEHYDIAETVSPKAVAWFEFCTVASAVYGQRLMVIVTQARAQRTAQRKASEQSSIFVPPNSVATPGETSSSSPQDGNAGSVDFGGAAFESALRSQRRH